MAYQVLSLKWRPQTFKEVVGQEHVTHTLTNAFKKDRVAQAYLFTGPRGVGKTTTARLVSKALNCLKTPGDFCNSCSNCMEITDGRNMDVLEIDGASNRGIDEIRNLREMIQYTPMNSQYKIFIIDEVHMLTTQAFNALLRTLEEPPKHGKFVLATTDIQKVPATIISRCQRFDFNRITASNIIDHVGTILDSENVSIDDESVKALASKADGSMRDALSILDQLIAYCGEKITFDDSTVVMGLIPHDTFFNVTKALKAKDVKSIVQLLHDTRMLGISAGEMAIGFNKHIRNLLLASVPGALDIYDLNLELKERYELVSKEWDRRDLLRIAEILTDMEAKIHRAAQPYILLEMMCLKLLEMDSTVSLENLLKQLKPSIQSEANDTSAVSQPSVPYEKDPQKSAFVHEVQGKTEDKNPPEELAVSPEAGVKSQKEEAGKESDPVNRNSISLEEVQSAWGEITKEVSASRPSIGTILEHCMINKAHGKVLEVVMTGQPKFNLNLLEKNKKLIEVQVEKSIEKSVILRFKIDEKGESNSTDSTKNTEEQNENNAPQKDQTLLQIIERFDGEIIT